MRCRPPGKAVRTRPNSRPFSSSTSRWRWRATWCGVVVAGQVGADGRVPAGGEQAQVVQAVGEGEGRDAPGGGVGADLLGDRVAGHRGEEGGPGEEEGARERAWVARPGEAAEFAGGGVTGVGRVEEGERGARVAEGERARAGAVGRQGEDAHPVGLQEVDHGGSGSVRHAPAGAQHRGRGLRVGVLPRRHVRLGQREPRVEPAGEAERQARGGGGPRAVRPVAGETRVDVRDLVTLQERGRETQGGGQLQRRGRSRPSSALLVVGDTRHARLARQLRRGEAAPGAGEDEAGGREHDRIILAPSPGRRPRAPSSWAAGGRTPAAAT